MKKSYFFLSGSPPPNQKKILMVLTTQGQSWRGRSPNTAGEEGEAADEEEQGLRPALSLQQTRLMANKMIKQAWYYHLTWGSSRSIDVTYYR